MAGAETGYSPFGIWGDVVSGVAGRREGSSEP
jgi:hypothetical protein